MGEFNGNKEFEELTSSEFYKLTAMLNVNQ